MSLEDIKTTEEGIKRIIIAQLVPRGEPIEDAMNRVEGELMDALIDYGWVTVDEVGDYHIERSHERTPEGIVLQRKNGFNIVYQGAVLIRRPNPT